MKNPRKVTVRGVDYWRSAKEMAAKGDTWPQHADGRSKKMGEMTPEQRKEMMRQSVVRVDAALPRS